MDPKLLDLTLGVKIPVTPGSKPVFSRGKLGEKLHRPSGSFDLGDPHGRRMSNEYNSLHDPHLKAYYQRKVNVQWLKRQGFVTSDGNVVCSLKEFNQYRQYRTMLKLEAQKAVIREQEKLREHLPKLEHAPKLPGAIDTSCRGPWALQPQKISCPGPQVLQPQKTSCRGPWVLQPQKPPCPPPPKGGNNAMKWGRRLRVNDAQPAVTLQEKLREHLPKLEQAPKLPGAIDTSCPGSQGLQPQKPSRPGPQGLQPQKTSCRGPLVLQPQKPPCPPPPKGGNNAMKWGRRLRVNDALGKGQTHAQSELEHKGAAGAFTAAEPSEMSLLHRRQQIEQVAKELMAPVLESWGKHTASSSSEASKPGSAVEETAQVARSEEEKSGQTETAACDRGPSRASLEHLARIVIDCLFCTLEAFQTSQCEHGDLCKYSRIVELFREELYKDSGSRPRSPAEGPARMKAKDSPGPLKSRAWSPGKEQGRPPNEMEGRAVPLRMPSPAPAPGFPERGKPVGGEPQQRGR